MYSKGFNYMQSVAYADDDAAASVVTAFESTKTRGEIGRSVVVVVVVFTFYNIKLTLECLSSCLIIHIKCV